MTGVEAPARRTPRPEASGKGVTIPSEEEAGADGVRWPKCPASEFVTDSSLTEFAVRRPLGLLCGPRIRPEGWGGEAREGRDCCRVHGRIWGTRVEVGRRATLGWFGRCQKHLPMSDVGCQNQR